MSFVSRSDFPLLRSSHHLCWLSIMSIEPTIAIAELQRTPSAGSSSNSTTDEKKSTSSPSPESDLEKRVVYDEEGVPLVENTLAAPAVPWKYKVRPPSLPSPSLAPHRAEILIP